MTEQKIVEIFKERNFRATPQRIAVYKYLREHPTHPDVDEIYKAVLADNPAFSRTTVYNSLQALEKEGLIQSVKIDSGKIHYDGDYKLHGHFLCEKCKRIYDFEVDDSFCKGIDGFEIKKEMYITAAYALNVNNFLN